MSSAVSDLTLLDAWRAGNSHAGSALFERHFDALHRYFRHRALGAEQDLTQRTFLACVEGKRQFRAESSFRTYLLRVARYQLLAHYREQRRQSQLAPLGGDEQGAVTSPSGVIASKQMHRVLLLALEKLPPEQREALMLNYWQNLSGADIARLLQIPETTARSRIHAASERLRKLLGQAMGTDGPRPDTMLELWTAARRVQFEIDCPTHL